MIESRRKFIVKLFTLVSSGLAISASIIHAPIIKAAQLSRIRFSLTQYDDTIEHLFNGEKLINNHNKIKISRLPYIAENGAVVPIKIKSTFDNITKIYILVEKNPHPLSAEFFLSPAVKAEVSARLKMAKTSKVIVIVEAGGKFYRKARKVKVAIDGCGG